MCVVLSVSHACGGISPALAVGTESALAARGISMLFASICNPKELVASLIYLLNLRRRVTFARVPKDEGVGSGPSFICFQPGDDIIAFQLLIFCRICQVQEICNSACEEQDARWCSRLPLRTLNISCDTEQRRPHVFFSSFFPLCFYASETHVSSEA